MTTQFVLLATPPYLIAGWFWTYFFVNKVLEDRSLDDEDEIGAFGLLVMTALWLPMAAICAAVGLLYVVVVWGPNQIIEHGWWAGAAIRSSFGEEDAFDKARARREKRKALKTTPVTYYGDDYDSGYYR